MLDSPAIAGLAGSVSAVRWPLTSAPFAATSPVAGPFASLSSIILLRTWFRWRWRNACAITLAAQSVRDLRASSRIWSRTLHPEIGDAVEATRSWDCERAMS